MQGESREDLTRCGPQRGGIPLGRPCGDIDLQTWYADSFPGFIEQCSRLILEDAGDAGMKGLILSGSFAGCEGSVVMLAGGPVLLSDIDILLVASSSESHAGLYSRRSAIGKACEELLPGARFCGSIDIGVMTEGELEGMPFSPGVFDMRERGILLHGGSGLFERFPRFTADEIGAAEAVRLLENRMAAFLGARPGTDRPEGEDLYRFLYAVSRVYTDIATASLCADGMYLSGYTARAGFVSSSPEAAKVREGLGESLTADIVMWTDFKVDPEARKVWSVESSASRMWLEAAGDLLAARDRSSRKDLRSSSGGRQGYMDLLRSWRPVAGEFPFPGRIRLLAGAIISGNDPGAHLRGESVRLIRHAAERGTEGTAAGAGGGYPHGRVSWERAASMTSSAWRRLVSGREEGSVE